MGTDIVTDQLRLMADAHPGEVAFRDVTAGGSLTFAEWEQRSNRLARGLVARGVAKGDRVGLVLPPQRSLDWVACYVAIHKAGAVAVPVNTRLAPREIDAILAHAEPALVVTADSDLAALESADGAGAGHGSGDGSTFQVPVEAEDLADILYTSGTTGRPKGVAVAHGSMSLLPTMTPAWTGPGWLSSSPLFTFAGTNQIYTAMKLGLTALHQPRFDADGWIDTVERERPTLTFLVPAMVELLLAHPRWRAADLSSLGLVAVGSAPLPVASLRQLRERFPSAQVTNNYNLTEAGSAYFHLPPDQAESRIGSIGRPQPPTEVQVVDDAGTALPAGEVGELLIRVPGRMRHYFRADGATGETWRDGWLHTGDLVRCDDEGYVYVVGRKKDLIIRGGNNIYAADVEAVLYEHPDVQHAAVAAIPHPVLGEDVGAWVVLRPDGSATPEDLQAHCATHLADYKVPRQVTLVDDLPRNAMGKVIKTQLPRPATGSG